MSKSSISHLELRSLFEEFWKHRPGFPHKEVPAAPLVLDSTTLFTSSGMQQLVPNLQGEPHPLGKQLYNIQPCFRATDIDEVGDNRHTTFFEMMGNWSLGSYFKEQQLAWCWDFFTKIIKLPEEKLYVTVFEGGDGVPRDTESARIWKNLGVAESHIRYYPAHKNWWSRAGTPDKMPPGEIGGPDSEVFYEFDLVKHDKKFGDHCHPNCDCGRFLEIGNSVFIQYRKKSDKTLEELPQKNVDFGGGLERILSAINNEPDIFKTDLFLPIIENAEKVTGKSYNNSQDQTTMRVIADHIKVAVFLIANGTIPSNKEHGYVLRRFLRRAAVKLHDLEKGINKSDIVAISNGVFEVYDRIYFKKETDKKIIQEEIGAEIYKFDQTLINGLKHIEKIEPNKVTIKFAFDLFQSYGFPFELTQELMREKGINLSKKQFDLEFEKHQQSSRTASSGMFKGGLADHSDQVLKYHTATHLMHQALRDVLGREVRQEGSNITGERLRFDFFSPRKPTDEEVKKVEAIISQKIQDKLPVHFEIMPKEKADKIGALSFFREKYGAEVKVYFVGDYSKEFCGGPHVKNTSEIGSVKIVKFKKIGTNLMRIYIE